MDRALYAKGKRIVAEGRVEVQEETDKAIYLLVKGEHDTYNVRLNRDHSHSCTCPYATLQGIPRGALCSHVVACVLYVADHASSS